MTAQTCTDSRLSDVPILAGADAMELARIDRLTTVVTVPAGRTLMNQGMIGHEFVMLLSGSAEVSVDGETVALLGPGDFVGEVSLLLGRPRTATVRATSPTELAIVAHGEFEQFLREAPSATRRLLRAVTERWHAMNQDLFERRASESAACPPTGR